jgi:hypothetical protein
MSDPSKWVAAPLSRLSFERFIIFMMRASVAVTPSERSMRCLLVTDLILDVARIGGSFGIYLCRPMLEEWEPRSRQHSID